jgi:dTDP-4-dehydrorhamnose reductase
VLRTAWVYSLHGHNFLRTMLRLAADREELRVVADQAGCPTPSWLIADVTARLLQGPGASGVYHLVTRGETTWHGFAEAIFAHALQQGMLPRAPRVVPITTAEFPTPARRPAYSVLDTTRLSRDAGLDLPDWRSALADTLGAARTA